MKKFVLLSIIFIIALLSNSFGQSVTTEPATPIGQTTATLNASSTTLDAGKTYFVLFYYDIAPNTYGSTIQSANFTGNTSHTFSANITGLSLNTTYNCRARLYEVISFDPPDESSLGYSANTESFTTDNIGQADSIIFSNIQGTQLTLSWDNGDGNRRIVVVREGTDPITNPANGETYNAAQNFSSPVDSTATGHYVVYDGTGTSVTVSGLKAATTYNFKVFDYIGTGASTIYQTTSDSTNNPLTQSTLKGEPITQASNVLFSSLTDSSFTTSWTRGGGSDGVLVLAKQGGTVTDVPVDGTSSYTADTAYGAGSLIGTSRVVFFGDAATVNIGNLIGGTNYSVRIFEYNNSGSNINYLTTSNGTNPNDTTTVKGTPSTQASNINFGVPTNSSVTSTWTSGNGDSTLIVVRPKDSTEVAPTQGVAYGADSDLSSLTPVRTGVGNFVVYNGPSTSVNVTGMNAGSRYIFTAYEYNNAGASSAYNTNTAASNPDSAITTASDPSNQISILTAATATADQIGLTWTNTGGDSLIILVKTSAIVQHPVDGTHYAIDDSINSAAVKYKGTGTSGTITGLSGGTTYYINAYSFNNPESYPAYETATITTNSITAATIKGTPSIQASNINFGTPDNTSVTVTWTTGNGDSTLIVARPKDSTEVAPTQGVAYGADSDLSSLAPIRTGIGNFVVYNGTGVLVDITGMNAGSKYIFTAYEYNNGGISSAYNVNTATSNPDSIITTASEPINQINTIIADSSATDQIGLTWTNTGGDSLLIVISTSSIDQHPVDGTIYALNDAINGGTVRYKGNGTSGTITGLSAGTKYYLRAYSYNNPESYPNYKTSAATGNPITATTAVAAPSTQASAIIFTDVATDSIVMQWTNGTGGNRIVTMKEGPGSIENPKNDTTYNASSDWTTKGRPLGASGYYTIYNGNQNSVTVRNLQASTAYYVQVFEYNNGAGAEKYNTTTTTGNPNDTITAKAAPSTQALNVSITDSTSSTMAISFAVGDGEGRILVASTSNSFSTDPVNGTAYTADSVYASGSLISGSGYVVYSGSGTSVTVTGLNASTKYYFKAFEFNNSGNHTMYCVTAGSNNPDSSTTYGAQTWVGTTADWNTTSNWSGSSVPTQYEDVTIPTSPTGGNKPTISSSSYTVSNITIQAGAYITISDGASLTANGNALLETPEGLGMPGQIFIPGTGSFNAPGRSTIERYLTSGWHHYSPSLTSITVVDENEFDFNAYDEPNAKWKYQRNGATLIPMQGYTMNRGTTVVSDTLAFTGTFNNGYTSLIVTNDTFPNPDTNEKFGWNLVGNPYPSSIDWELDAGWTRSKIDHTIYIWNASSSTYTNYTMDDAGSFIIPPMQAFFVHLTTDSAASVELGVSNLARVTTTADFKGGAIVKPTVKLSVSNNKYSSTTSLKFYNDATELFDPKYDAFKLLGYNDSIPEPYTIIKQNTLLVNNVFPGDTLTKLDKDGIIYRFGIQEGNATTLKISLDELIEIPQSIQIYLVDTQEGTQVNLRNESYEFSTAGGIDDSRFQIVLKNTAIEVQTIAISTNFPGDSVETSNTMQLSAEVLPGSASNSKVVWSVDNSTLASIDADSGLLSALAEGTVTVTASATDGSNISSTKEIKVYAPIVPVSSIALSHGAVGDSLSLNTSLQLSAEVLPANATNSSITWSVNDNDLATIDSLTGLLKAIATGVIEVTATANDNSAMASSVTLKFYDPAILIDSLSITASNDSVEINKTLKFEAAVFPVDATNQTYIWRVNNTELAVINATTGLLSAKKAGIVEVTATANDGSETSSTFSLTIYENIILIDSIAINAPNDSLEINSSMQLAASVYPINASNQTLTWSIDNGNIASINALTGILSSKSTGTVRVFATANDDSAVVSVISIIVYEPFVPIDSIAIISTVDSVKADNTIQFIAQIYPDNATNKQIAWSVDSTNIASINKSSGLLRAISNGTVKVTVTASDSPDISTSIKITVYQQTFSVNNLLINSDIDSVAVDSTIQISAQVSPENATNQKITWSIDNDAIVSIDSLTGIILGKAEGTVTVTARANDGSEVFDTITIKVYQLKILVDNIEIESVAGIDSILVDSIIQLWANIQPTDASEPSVTWDTDNYNIATIDQTGLLTGISPGSVKVTASANDGSDIIAEFMLTVYKSGFITVSSIEIESAAMIDSVLIDNSIQLWANIEPSNASDTTVTWDTDNHDIATINSTGLLTGITSGTVTVSASANDASRISDEFTVTVYNITDIKDNLNSSFVKLYPNPTSGKLTLESTITNCNYKIYTSIGKTIKTAKFSNQTVIDLSNIENGSYFIEFTKNNMRQIELFIKN